jgi:hypothetical protein
MSTCNIGSPLVFQQNICYVNLFLYIADQQKGLRRLSHKGFQGALTIALKRDEDGYCLPYQVMTNADMFCSKLQAF